VPASRRLSGGHPARRWIKINCIPEFAIDFPIGPYSPARLLTGGHPARRWIKINCIPEFAIDFPIGPYSPARLLTGGHGAADRAGGTPALPGLRYP